MKNVRDLLLVTILLVWAVCAEARFVGPTYAPVERLIENTRAFVKEHPEDGHGYYTLGRIHYLAFVNKASLVGGYPDSDGKPRMAPDWLQGNFARHARRHHAEQLILKQFGYSSVKKVPKDDRDDFHDAVRRKRKELESQGWKYPQLGDKQLFENAAAAVRNFRKAVSLDKKNGLYHLGLASVLEQYVDFLAEQKDQNVPVEFRGIIIDRSRDVYHTAYKHSIVKDLKVKYRPLAGLKSLVAYEAGAAYVRLSEAAEGLSKDDKHRVAIVKKDLKKLEGLLKPRWVTPIVFSFEQGGGLSDLLEPSLRVRFDLDGDGAAELWPWVKPTTGILVWDSEVDGVIRSGRQMFGSVSWWLFFADGYRALDTLDDNRDSSLAGRELAGISVWFDYDSDGVSDAGEVVALERLGVAAIATAANGQDAGCLMNSAGLTLGDGRTLPTYDWVASPVDSTP